MQSLKRPSPREAARLLGHRQVVLKLDGPGDEPATLKVLCASTYEWLDLQEAVSKDPFPGWAGKFYVLSPGVVVLSAQLVDTGTEDLDACIQHRAADRREK